MWFLVNDFEATARMVSLWIPKNDPHMDFVSLSSPSHRILIFAYPKVSSRMESSLSIRLRLKGVPSCRVCQNLRSVKAEMFDWLQRAFRLHLPSGTPTSKVK